MSVFVSCKWADESAVQVSEASTGNQGVYSLYKRGLGIASRISDVNDEWDPPVMERDLLV